MKSVKQWVFILIALIMIGAVTVIIVINKDEKPNKGEVVSDSKSFSDEVKEIVVEIGACEFEIRESATNETKVEYKKINETYFTAEVKEGVLTVRYEPKGSVNINFFGIKIGSEGVGKEADSKIVLFLPEEAYYETVTMKFGAASVGADKIAAKKLEIDVGAGSLEADMICAEEKAKIAVGAGAVHSSQVTLTNAELYCGVGEMELSGFVTGESSVECGVGEVELTLMGSQEDYRGALNCGLGEIKFGDISIDGSGKKEFGDSDAEYQMDVKCGVGEVEIRFE